MEFRLADLPHHHKATFGGEEYLCVRQTVRTETGVTISWSALRGAAVLKSDCRTLNEAKNLCRAAARAAVPG